MPSHLPELETILHSGSLAYSAHGKAFEQTLREFVGVDYLMSVNSFNSAVLVALITLGIKPDDEVIASPMACLASNQPFVTMGAKVVWADVDPQTGTLDPESVRKAITPKTKVIFHNHYCGYPGYCDEINGIGQEKGIYIIDDAIEAFGSVYKGRMMGCTGADVTVFSFQAVRLPTTIDGGALVFKDKSLYDRGLQVRDSGIDRQFFRDGLGEINTNYDISVPGFGATMSELNSYIGLMQMNDLKGLLEKQRQHAKEWDATILSDYPGCTLFNHRSEILPNYWVYGLLARDKATALLRFRSEGYIASGVHFPNNRYSVFGSLISLKGVDEFHDHFLAVPSGWWY